MKHLTIFIMLSLMIMVTTITNALAKDTPKDNQGRTSALIINISGFDNSQGVAKVALINSKENYEAEKPYQGFNFKIIDNRVVKTLRLPHGEYAIKVYHDENSNDELDTRMFGIPKERYGFSNDAKGSFGPPEYEAAAFVLDSEKKQITINIQ
jgi:uncharacterized protein (DUF2141 family)